MEPKLKKPRKNRVEKSSQTGFFLKKLDQNWSI
jgi:hypothetical protein